MNGVLQCSRRPRRSPWQWAASPAGPWPARPQSFLLNSCARHWGCLRNPKSREQGSTYTSFTLAANLFVVVTYGMVGWYLADYQVRRFVAEGAWSLSGVSLLSVFFTCALMHLTYATSGPHNATLPFDLLGIPASIYFLWVVKRVHSDSVVDWNRRPLVGAAATPERSAPWR